MLFQLIRMTFLSPAVLWGLLALSIPIIVHFFNLQRPRLVLFSNVAFVKEVKRTVVRRVNFQRWLLLLLRLLGLAALVFMFANPVQTDQGSPLLQGSRSVAIVMDNSLSMQASNERGEYWRQAISLSRNLIRAHGSEDEFLVTTSGNLALQAGFSGMEESLEQLEALSLSQSPRSLASILKGANDLFDRAQGQTRQLYLISDFQTATLLQDSLKVQLEDSSLQINLIPVATRTASNVFIANHEILSRIVEPDQPVTIRLTLINDGNAAVQDLSVRILLGGEVVAISNQVLEAGEEKPLELTFTPNSSGWLQGNIEIDDLPIDFDNKRYFSLYVPDRDPILLVESTPSPKLRLLYEQVFTQFNTRVISARNLAGVNLSDYRSVVWVGLDQLSSGLADQLSRFLQNGGSLTLFPGPSADLNSWNAWLGQIGYGSLGAAIAVEGGMDAREFDLEHPIFEGVFAPKNGRPAEPDRFRLFKYYPATLSGSTAQSRIIRLDNQSPVLTESRVGTGVLYFFHFFPADDWTDLQLKTLFPPLMYRTTQLMNQTGQTSPDQEMGLFEPLVVKANSQERIDLLDAAGNAFTPERFDNQGQTRLLLDNMGLMAGNYRVVQQDSLLLALSLNVSDAESRLAFAEEDELEEAIRQIGVQNPVRILPPTGDQLTDRIQVDRDGWPLWRWFLLVALACLLVEALVLGGGFSWRKLSKAN